MADPKMLSVEAAREIMLAAVQPTSSESVPIAEGAGRTLSEDVVAQLTQPPFDASAMDGYAVRSRDVETLPATLRVIGESPAGAPFEGAVGAGQAVRIFTGGHVPADTDEIVIQENTNAVSGDVTVVARSDVSHIRGAGLDFKKGDVLREAGMRLSGRDIALVAAANVPAVEVARRPRIAVAAIGDELVEPGGVLAPGQVVNSNAYGLSALCTEWGAGMGDRALVRDNPNALAAFLKAQTEAEIIVVIGGASVGDYDFARPAAEKAGFTIEVSKVAVKPGKPTWFAKRGVQTVLGLPGNPASALVCAHLFLRPLIFAFLGRPPDHALTWVLARATRDIAKNGPRETYLRAEWRLTTEGFAEASPHAEQDSSQLRPLAVGNALIRRAPHAPRIVPGAMVEVLKL